MWLVSLQGASLFSVALACMPACESSLGVAWLLYKCEVYWYGYPFMGKKGHNLVMYLLYIDYIVHMLYFRNIRKKKSRGQLGFH